MPLWKVRVDCRKQGTVHPVIRRFVVDAPDSASAFSAAVKVAEDNASFGPKWIEFVAREAASVTLPLEIG